MSDDEHDDAGTIGGGERARAGKEDKSEIAVLIRSIFANGSVEVSLSLGYEDYLGERDGAILGATASDTFEANHAYICSCTKQRVDDRVVQALAMAAVLATNDVFAPKDNATRYPAAPKDDGAAAAAAGGPAVAIKDFDGHRSVRDAIALIAATKVNWFKCNHHTGGRVATGFALKALRLVGGADYAVSEEITSALWRAGHWFDTRCWLVALGVEDIVADAGAARALAYRISADEAVAKRIRSAPAGTAAFCALFQGLRVIVDHPIAAHANAPALPAYADWAALYDDIVAHPALYHIGAMYLTGKERRVPVSMSAPVIGYIYTCLKYMNPAATILKAAAFNGYSEDKSTLLALKAAGKFKSQERTAIGALAWSSKAITATDVAKASIAGFNAGSTAIAAAGATAGVAATGGAAPAPAQAGGTVDLSAMVSDT